MLKELKLVQGAVARKNFIPELTHFCIKDGLVRGYNGTLALCSPIPFDIDCLPKAIPLVKAIQNCEETVQLSMTKANRLAVRSGPFKAFIECVDGEGMHAEPEGEQFAIDGKALLEGIKAIYPFIGDDASRPWSNGVLLRGQSAFATNNIIAVEYWVGSTFPLVCNVPRAAIKEILRINEAPTHAQATERSITFHYTDGRWVRSQLFSLEWPNINLLLDTPANPSLLDDRIFEGLDVVKPFVDNLGKVYIGNGMLYTHDTEGEGAMFEIPDLQFEGIFQIDKLLLLKDIATQIDWSTYPKPCLFFGEKIRGAIVGMRK